MQRASLWSPLACSSCFHCLLPPRMAFWQCNQILVALPPISALSIDCLSVASCTAVVPQGRRQQCVLLCRIGVDKPKPSRAGEGIGGPYNAQKPGVLGDFPNASPPRREFRVCFECTLCIAVSSTAAAAGMRNGYTRTNTHGHEGQNTMALRMRQRSPSGESDDAGRQHSSDTHNKGGRNSPSHEHHQCLPKQQARPLEAVPTPVLLIASEWLAVADLLTLGTVDRSFRGLTKDETLWKAAAHHLWKSALLEGNTLCVDIDEAGLKDVTGGSLHTVSVRVGAAAGFRL